MRFSPSKSTVTESRRLQRNPRPQLPKAMGTRQASSVPVPTSFRWGGLARTTHRHSLTWCERPKARPTVIYWSSCARRVETRRTFRPSWWIIEETMNRLILILSFLLLGCANIDEPSDYATPVEVSELFVFLHDSLRDSLPMAWIPSRPMEYQALNAPPWWVLTGNDCDLSPSELPYDAIVPLTNLLRDIGEENWGEMQPGTRDEARGAFGVQNRAQQFRDRGNAVGGLEGELDLVPMVEPFRCTCLAMVKLLENPWDTVDLGR
jgi:hypothetical protein